VGDQQNRSALPKTADRIEQRVFGSSVEGRGGLVEYDEWRVSKECPGERDPLPLADG